jgi:hypothetical protein
MPSGLILRTRVQATELSLATELCLFRFLDIRPYSGVSNRRQVHPDST